MEEAETTSGAKKQKLDTNSSSSPPSKKKGPPPYGSQEYWEERYQKHRRLEKKSNGNNGTDNSSDALPYHAWYFSYSELSPLILPLILGGRDEGFELMGGFLKEDAEEIGNTETAENEPVERDSEPVETSNNVQASSSTCVDGESNHDDAADDEQGSEHNQEEYEEVYDEDEEDEEEEMGEREGLAINGAISILEIGCGDMPLGRDLSMELTALEDTTGAKAGNIVEKIVCCDYSPAVIDLCKENQRRDMQLAASENRKGVLTVDYITADARKLQYPDSSFHLVLEKGTLDAMLSDREDGESNCVKVVAESARVLKEGGYILLVSHLNAHTTNGIDWLNAVVVPGLRGGGISSTWEIEIHGSDGTFSNDHDDGEESEDEQIYSEDANESGKVKGSKVESQEFASKRNDGDKECDSSANTGEAQVSEKNGAQSTSAGPPSGGPGPAVYVIHNLSKPKPTQSELSEDDDPPTVPLKFFSY